MNEWVDEFLPYERKLFFALNGSESTFLDNLMWTFSGRFVWIPLILFILFMIFYKKNWKEALLVILFLVLVVTVCDQIASSIFKPMFHRLRPTHHPDFSEFVDTMKGYKGGRYGFISSHAANSFGIAVFLSLIFRQKWLAIFSFLLWALVNSYSRIYLGVHFISDILMGMLVGTVIAFLLFTAFRYSRCVLFKIPKSECKMGEIYTPFHAKILAIGIGTYIGLIIALSPILVNLKH